MYNKQHAPKHIPLRSNRDCAGQGMCYEDGKQLTLIRRPAQTFTIACDHCSSKSLLSSMEPNHSMKS